MTELIEPMSDVSPVRQVEAQSSGTQAGHPPTFAELVYAHHDWWRARQAGKPDSAAEAAYDSVLSAFEEQHVQIIQVYWCSEIESAVALTERKRLGGLCSPVFGFQAANGQAQLIYLRGHRDGHGRHRRDLHPLAAPPSPDPSPERSTS